MKKQLLLLVLVFCANHSFAKQEGFTDDSLNNSLSIFGKFTQQDVVVELDVLFAPLDGKVEDGWKFIKTFKESGEFYLDFTVGFIYLVMIKQPNQPDRALYIKVTHPSAIDLNIDLSNNWEGMLYYDVSIENYLVYRFEKKVDE